MWLGQVLRHESLLHDVTEGRMRGKATRRRKRMHLLSDLMKGKYVALKRKKGSAPSFRPMSIVAKRLDGS